MLNNLLSQGGRLLSVIPAGAVAPVAAIVPIIGYVLLSREIVLHLSVRKGNAR